MDSIWIVGDQFVSTTYDSTIKRFTAEDSFVQGHYEVKFLTAANNTNYTSVIGRVCNSIAQALATIVTPLPKMIFIILEDDVINHVQHKRAVDKNLQPRDPVTLIYNKLTKWLANKICKMLDAHNDALPPKAEQAVHVIWLLSSDHVNYGNVYQRNDFKGSIIKTTKFQERHHAFELRQGWDKEDTSLFLQAQNRFTSNGIMTYWRAVDKVIMFSDAVVNRAK